LDEEWKKDMQLKRVIFGIVLAMVSTTFAQESTTFAQEIEDPVGLASWRKGETRIHETTFRVFLTPEQPDFQGNIDGKDGEKFEFRIRFRPIERLRRDHWIVQLFELTSTPVKNVKAADLFDTTRPNSNLDFFPTDGDIRYLYPETRPLVWINRTRLLTEGNAPLLYPIKRPRKFFVAGFKATVRVRSVELNKDDPDKFRRMELDIEFVNLD
jgi:hypothetical protein